MPCVLRHLLLALCLLLALPAGAQSTSTVAGRIEEVRGDVRIYDPARNMRIARLGESVHEGDSIVTGADGEVHLAMEDEGQIAVRPNTRLRIARYKAEGGSDDASIIALVQGALRSVTGWIGKYNPKGYAIRTPTATIGVRGTDHETLVLPEDARDGEAGTYDRVNHGATLLTTKHGQAEVRPNQAGFVALRGAARPRLLATVPAVFRPAQLDGRFERLHETIRQRIDSRRMQRIETLRERRPKVEAARREATGAVSRRDDAASRARHQERREQAEQRRQAQKREFDERQRRFEERRPGEMRRQQEGEARRSQPGDSRRLQESGAHRRPDDAPGRGRGAGGGPAEGRGGRNH